MARKETVAKKNAASKVNVDAKAIWKISGTDRTGATKEELKPIRRQLNADAGIHEVDTTINGQLWPANPSNAWPYRITKTAAHPHNAA